MLSDKEIGQIIKNKRLKLNMTQTELGHKLGVGAGAVNKWETGKVSNIKRDVLHGLATILKIHPAYLIGLEFNPKEYIISSSDFSDDEMSEIIDYVRFVVFKRDKDLQGLQHTFLKRTWRNLTQKA